MYILKPPINKKLRRTKTTFSRNILKTSNKLYCCGFYCCFTRCWTFVYSSTHFPFSFRSVLGHVWCVQKRNEEIGHSLARDALKISSVHNISFAARQIMIFLSCTMKKLVDNIIVRQIICLVCVSLIKKTNKHRVSFWTYPDINHQLFVLNVCLNIGEGKKKMHSKGK